MADDKYTFEQARVRLEEIVTQVRRKDVSLEASIELLEEGVRLANTCTELSDHTEWQAVVEEQEAARDSSVDSEAAGSSRPDDFEPQDVENPASAADVTTDGSADSSDSDEATDSQPVESAEE